MNLVIEQHYIKEAKRIIDTYKNVIDDINIFETTLIDNKDKLLKLKENIDDLRENQGTNLLKRSQLTDFMNSYEIEINKMQDQMLPYVKQLEKLKKDSNTLYGILKEKYPGVSDEDLQKHLHSKLNIIK